MQFLLVVIKNIFPVLLSILISCAWLVATTPASAAWYDEYDFAGVGAVRYYPLDENANDVSGNARHGTVRRALPSAGRYDGGYEFIGQTGSSSSSYITLPDIPHPAAITISAWVNLDNYADGTTSRESSFIFHRRAHYNDLSLFIESTGEISVYMLRGSYVPNNEVTSTAIVPLNSWHHIVATMDENYTRVYLDGALVGEAASAGALVWNGSYYTTSIGLHSDSVVSWWDPFDGRIDEVALFDRALSGAEVTQLASDGNGNSIADFWEQHALTPIPTPTPSYSYTVHWTRLTTNDPPARTDHAMVYDSIRNVVVLYGGADTSARNDKHWEFDGSSWTNRTFTMEPGPVTQHAMAYDSSRETVYLFHANLGPPTWKYYHVGLTNNWSPVTSATAPAFNGAMEYFPPWDQSLMFGRNPVTLKAETWSFDGSMWTYHAPSSSPPALSGCGMAYDPTRGVMVVFGGYKLGSVPSNETWEFDGANWTQATTSAAPPAGHAQTLTFDPTIDKCVLCTGGTYQNWHNQTWIYDGFNWTQVEPLPTMGPLPNAPSARYGAQMVYHAGMGKLLLYGGYNGAHLGDTWVGQINLPQATPTPSPTLIPTLTPTLTSTHTPTSAPNQADIAFFVLDDYGAVHTGGAANQVLLTGGPYFGWDIARAMELVFGLPTSNPSHIGIAVVDGYGALHTLSCIRPTQDFYFLPEPGDMAVDLALFQKDLGGVAGNIGFYVLDRKGKLWPGGMAQWHIANVASVTPALDGITVYAVDVELADETGYNGWIMDNKGNVYPFGDAEEISFPTNIFQDNWVDFEVVEGQYVRMDASGQLAWSGTPIVGWQLPSVDGELMIDFEVQPGRGLVALDRYGTVYSSGRAYLPDVGSGPPYFGFEAALDLEIGPPFTGVLPPTTKTPTPTITPTITITYTGTPTNTDTPTPTLPPNEIYIHLSNLPANAKPLIMVKIPAGSFLMGSNDPGWSSPDEQPVHSATIEHDFYMSKFELTQAQWFAVMENWPGAAPSANYGSGDDYPAYNISWNDCQSLITKLSKLGQGTFRLPSETEWEYCCRAGSTTRWYFGDTESQLVDYAWYSGNNTPSGSKLVGGKLPNNFGLYDMSGNVWEWCEDDWHDSYSETERPDDGSAWVSTPRAFDQLIRGGAYYLSSSYSRCAKRLKQVTQGRTTEVGVRLVREVHLENNVGFVYLESGGSLNGTSIDSDNRTIVVEPGQTIIGSIKVETNNLMGSNAVAPLGGTVDWGDRTTQCWETRHISTGIQHHMVSVEKVAPSTPGTYHIIIAFVGEFNISQVMSRTNWYAFPDRRSVWNDGNDVGFDWSAGVFQTAIQSGAVLTPQLMTADTYSHRWLPATVVTVIVDIPPTPTPTPTADTPTRTNTPTDTGTPTTTPTNTLTPTPTEEITIALPDLAAGAKPLVLVKIHSGSFMMGRYSPYEQDSSNDEDPQHQVGIGYEFYMGKYEVTQAQWEAVMGTTPWQGQPYVLDHQDSPAVYVSWGDISGANCFLEKLNALGQGTFRLPSEAEWEYCCRAGTTTRFYWGDDSNYTQIGNYAWYHDNTWKIGQRYAHIVGLKLPNAWGLHDMSGNVYEWCADDWHDNYLGASGDGSAWITYSSSARLIRGGGAEFDAKWCRSAARAARDPNHRYYPRGLRIVWEDVDYPTPTPTNTPTPTPTLSGETITIPLANLPAEAKPLVLVKIAAGSFMMGRYSGEQDSYPEEDPRHQVDIGYDFYMGRYEITKAQWEAIMNTTPWSELDDQDSPAVWRSWNDCQSFVIELNKLGQGTFRLPSEAEWEYVCRAGTNTRFYWGDDPDYSQIGNYAWYKDNTSGVAESYAHVVGLKLPNAWGLFDMSGNVWEWCEDDWQASYYGADRPDDGSAWVGSPRIAVRMFRGGSWGNTAHYSRSASRNSASSPYFANERRVSFGFRIVREAS
jgi:formylglycine-generating enzyme required for sulfatase activity